MSHPSVAAIQRYENAPHTDLLHQTARLLSGYCRHQTAEPLCLPTRPFPRPVTKRALDTTLVATVCLDCHTLRWVSIEEFD